MGSFKLLTTSNAKTAKSMKGGRTRKVLVGILHLAPADQSGHEVCPARSAGCTAACLNTAGRGRFAYVQQARERKTIELFKDRTAFIDKLAKDIRALERKAKREGAEPAVRLNGTSDLPFEKFRGSNGLTLMEQFPHIQFYDYTKIEARMHKMMRGDMPANYDLTFSQSETNHSAVQRVLDAGGRVATVFNVRKSDTLPMEYAGHTVVDADETDTRYTEPQGVIAGLRAKGDAKHDASGFVVHV